MTALLAILFWLLIGAGLNVLWRFAWDHLWEFFDIYRDDNR